MQSSALVKSNKITTGNKITAYSLGKALTCKVMPICSCSISKEALKVPLSLSAISFCFYFGPPAPCHRFISFFFSCRTRPKGGVGSTWARISGLPPISRHLPAWYQSTLYSHPTEKQPTLKETEGDLVWWRYEVREREEERRGRKKDRNRSRE